jgi:hypothetical protein
MPGRMAIACTCRSLLGRNREESIANKGSEAIVAGNPATMASRFKWLYGMVAVNWLDATLSVPAASTLFTWYV